MTLSLPGVGLLARAGVGGQVTLMGVMLMGKLRGLPAHTDVVAGFRFGRVVRARLVRTSGLVLKVHNLLGGIWLLWVYSFMGGGGVCRYGSGCGGLS